MNGDGGVVDGGHQGRESRERKGDAALRPLSLPRWVLGGLKTNVFLSRTLSESFFLPMTYNGVVILKVTARLSPSFPLFLCLSHFTWRRKAL